MKFSIEHIEPHNARQIQSNSVTVTETTDNCNGASLNAACHHKPSNLPRNHEYKFRIRLCTPRCICAQSRSSANGTRGRSSSIIIIIAARALRGRDDNDTIRRAVVRGQKPRRGRQKGALAIHGVLP